MEAVDAYTNACIDASIASPEALAAFVEASTSFQSGGSFVRSKVSVEAVETSIEVSPSFDYANQ